MVSPLYLGIFNRMTAAAPTHDAPLDTTHDYRRLLLDEVPMLDVRAPIEFAAGALPHAENLPLMNAAERAQVGTCYKQQGQDAAIALGHRLVSGATRAARVAAWADFARRHPQGVLYCARGGLRSQTVQQWLASDAGVAMPRVAGGFRALRGFVLQTLHDVPTQGRWTLLGGWTGCGKTERLLTLPGGIDLEGLARHRGSSFGALPGGQPAQIDFEHRLGVALLKAQAAGICHFVLEDEGHHIGQREVPQPLRQRMATAPVVWLDEAFEDRVERLLRDYVIDLRAAFVRHAGDTDGPTRWGEQLQRSLDNIRKRLGGERHQRLRAVLDEALAEQARSGELARHRDWIAALLREYYDPMYAYQRRQLAERVVCSGPWPEVRAFFEAAQAG